MPLNPITIIGGGLAGLTLGIGLRRHGIPVTIREAGSYPRHRVCGEFISGRGYATLARLGLREKLIESGAITATTAMFLSGNAKSPARPLPHPALCLSRFVLDTLLADVFRGMGGELRENERWREDSFAEGVVRANGRRAQPTEDGWHWYGLKIHARNLPLQADLEMHIIHDGYVGLTRLPNNEVDICGLFRRSAHPNGSSAPRVQSKCEPPRSENPKRTPPQSQGLPNNNPEGIAPSSPGLRGTSYPGLRSPEPSSTLKGLCLGFARTFVDEGLPRAWQEVLKENSSNQLSERLAKASLDETSSCSVAGLSLHPRRAATQTELCIGDSLTMTPPVTGNGMSMAFESAELAIEPLIAYSRGQLDWGQARKNVAAACDRAFTRRLTWARWLQWMMFSPLFRGPMACVVLRSGRLWRTMFTNTR